MTLNPQEYARARYADRTASRVARPTDHLRHALRRVLGNMDYWERVPLNPRPVATVTLDGYRRETVHFATRPGLDAFAYVLIPDGMTGPRPAVICLPGHGRGADSFAGINEDGTQRPLGAAGEYHRDFALECVRQGYITLVLELASFGHRQSEMGPNAGASSCARDSMAALMLGESMIGWRVWDTLRAVDFLQARPDVDPARIATIGISGGGLVSLFAAALDTRIAACVVSAYLNTFEASVLTVSHCVDNYAPGLLALAEMPQIAALIAPRPLHAESGDHDPIFPRAGFEQAVAFLRDHYTRAGVPDRFTTNLFDGDHRWDGAGVWPFLQKHLGA